VPLLNYLVGAVYDLPANIANYLVAEGFAIFEKRNEKKGPDQKEIAADAKTKTH
jgi:hypothetical protein